MVSTTYTIGYEGTDIDRFVLTLQEAGVGALADVRALALSRKKGFSKNALRSRLAQEDIGYFHFQALGDPKPGREAARAGRFAEFRRIYNRHLISADAQDALNALTNLAVARTVCLMCFEREPENCHRSIVGDALRPHGIAIQNLFSPSSTIHAVAATLSSRSRQSTASAE